MKKIFKMLLTTCLLLLAVCGASLSVSARTYYYKGLISIDPSFPDSVFDANEEIQIPLTVKRYLSNNISDFLSKYYCDVYAGRKKNLQQLQLSFRYECSHFKLDHL